MLRYIITPFVLLSCSTFYTYERLEIKEPNLKSIVFTGYGSGTYSNPRINTYLDELEDLNANMASFLYTCYTKNKSSADIDCNSYDSLTLEEVDNAIKLAKKRKLLVSLRTYIDLKDQTWRCLWDPKDKEILFQNLKEHLVKTAKFAEKRKIELLILGAEYCQLTQKKYLTYWLDIISEVRKVYRGKITYGSNWGVHNKKVEWQEIGFWDKLDYIGIDHYMPIPNKIPPNDITDYQKIQFRKYAKLSNKLNVPLLFTEIGFPGVDNGNLSPWEWRSKGDTNEKKQALYYKKTLSALKSLSSNNGIFIWRKLSAEPNEMKRYKDAALGYELYNRKAWYEIQNFFIDY